jgi:hypothetical protein
MGKAVIPDLPQSTKSVHQLSREKACKFGIEYSLNSAGVQEVIAIETSSQRCEHLVDSVQLAFEAVKFSPGPNEEVCSNVYTLVFE